MSEEDTNLTQAYTSNLYRPNVGIVVLNHENKVWIGKRHGTSHDFSWQCPQGGVDEGEELEVAARRELFEETGIGTVEYIGRTKEWVYYDFPPEVRARRKIGKDFKGQKQIWFLYRFHGEDSEINLEAHHEIEFEAWEWCVIDGMIERVISFKRDSYRAVFEELAHLIG